MALFFKKYSEETRRIRRLQNYGIPSLKVKKLKLKSMLYTWINEKSIKIMNNKNKKAESEKPEQSRKQLKIINFYYHDKS
jgi:hypothetical protein